VRGTALKLLQKNLRIGKRAARTKKWKQATIDGERTDGNDMGPIAGKNERMNREHREPSLWKAQIEEIAYRHIGIEEERPDCTYGLLRIE
jgi:hypothetical protein